MSESHSSRDILHWFKVLFRGIGQIVYQDHATTGLFFVAGIAVGSPIFAAGAVLGAAIGLLTAIILRYDRQQINDGIYGFNSCLVGIGLLFYLDEYQPYVWALVVIGSVISTIITYYCRRYLPFPTYTGPFIVTTWFILVSVHAIVGHTMDHAAVSTDPQNIPDTFVEEVLAGGAEIMFGATALTGLFFVIGVTISNWRHGLLVFLGSMIGTLTAIYHHDETQVVAIGIYGYNAALAASGITLWRKSLLIAILASIVSVPITEFFGDLGGTFIGIPALTSPFVFACWMVLAVGVLEKYFYDIDFTKILQRTMNSSAPPDSKEQAL